MRYGTDGVSGESRGEVYEESVSESGESTHTKVSDSFASIEKKPERRFCASSERLGCV